MRAGKNWAQEAIAVLAGCSPNPQILFANEPRAEGNDPHFGVPGAERFRSVGRCEGPSNSRLG
jgi:hypothetical protein